MKTPVWVERVPERFLTRDPDCAAGVPHWAEAPLDVAINAFPPVPEDAVMAVGVRFVCATEVWKLIAPVVGEIREIGLLSGLLNSALRSAAVNVSPAIHVLILASAIVVSPQLPRTEDASNRFIKRVVFDIGADLDGLSRGQDGPFESPETV